MSPITLDVYLFFTGNCVEAMEFYKTIFGGELTIQKYGDVPDMPAANEADKDKVMHADLKGGLIHLMASDSTQHKSFGQSFISISLSSTDQEKMQDIFNKLAEGGEVTMPLQKTFWNALFGTVTDKFGVEWMINIEEAK